MLRHPLPARLLRFIAWLIGIFSVCAGVALLLLRFAVLPQVNNYRGDIERALSEAMQLDVSIGSIEGRMQGIRPRLDLRHIAISDKAGRPALSFDNVAGVVGWSSLLAWSPRFYLLEVAAPVLAVRRDADGQLFVAGLQVNANAAGPDFSAWILAQHRIVVRDAQISWNDALRQAPPLAFDHLNLRLEKTVLGRHLFGITAQPPAAVASHLDLRGEFSGDSLTGIRRWAGEVYAQAADADLAAWHPWVDYPVELSRGRGALRLWLDFAQWQPVALTADLSLTDVQTRLAPKLEMLSLKHIDGRLQLKREGKKLELTARRLSLATAGGINVKPTDLHVRSDESGGDFAVNQMDLQALATLSAYLPLPPKLGADIASHAPRGTLEKFNLRWNGQQWPFASYRIQGGFNRLAVASVGSQPGFSGLSGTIEGNQDAGVLRLVGRSASLSLPTVFRQALPLDTLSARVRWKRKGKNTELELTQTQFRNADAEGVANGTYVMTAQGKGSIDLEARLNRASAAAVWRYIPLQAGPHVGPFLQEGLTEGSASDVTLKLKGDLDKFPFADRGGNGIFHVHGQVRGGVLRFAKDWPAIENINGEIDFAGPGMTISANEARINGVRVGPVKAVIPDLNVHEHQLLVEGKAAGATADFLKFIEASPVGEKIDHFTEAMAANGNGALDLKLMLPLAHLDQSTVGGSYRFDGNRLTVDPEMPPLDEVRGHIEFNTKSLSAKGVTASIQGLPIKLNLQSQSDGGVLAEVSGDLNAAQLRKLFQYAGLQYVSGNTRWNGAVRARKNSAEVRFASDLVGLSSALPEPFNKSATQALPLVFERKAADLRHLPQKPRDKNDRYVSTVTLGNILRSQMIYRREDGNGVLERGLVSIGEVAARLPERGLTVSVSQPAINADAWRAMLADAGGSRQKPESASKPAGASPAAKGSTSAADGDMRVEVRTTELQAMGRIFHDVKLDAVRSASAGANTAGNSWSADINSRELAAKLVFATGGDARLSGRISRLTLPDAATQGLVSETSVTALPSLDLTLDHLVIKGRDYGELRLSAENKGADWVTAYSVRNEDGALEGKGSWQAAGGSSAPLLASETKMEFNLHARNIDRFLTRLGYPNTVRRGNADLSGNLSWKGAPQDFHIASLNGQLVLDARNGQFNKLEPGVGRLLGILSLQSLQRRLSLDFRDIFSEGLAFDSMKGQIGVDNGVLHTQDLLIKAPSATVQMAGSVDLDRETQDLKIRVQPKLGDSVAVGALIANPAIGATAWAFNKLFGNPFDNAFAYDYSVSGSWTDPKVEKAGASSAPSGNPSGKGAAN